MMNTQLERVKVVDRVDNQYAGSTKALKKRIQQLSNMIFAAKQHIQVVRTTSQLAIDAHKDATKALQLPKALEGEPAPPRNGEVREDGSKNPLLAETGLRILIDKLASAELATAKCFEKVVNPKNALSVRVGILNMEQEEIDLTLLDNNRLGKSHQREEQILTDKAEDVNDYINLLHTACTNHGVVLHPLLDPYILRIRTEYKMRQFLQREHEYEKLCLKELRSISQMEERVFETMRGLPTDMEKVMTPLRNECIKILEPVGNLEKVDPLTEWNAFVERHGDRFVPENEVLKGTEFPEDANYKKFEITCQPDLEIYQKLPRETPTSEKRAGSKKDILDVMKRVKELMTPAEHGYAVRGVWYVSRRGNLIEFDHKECKAVSIFDLRRCKLGILAPDERERYGYFVLEGIKQHDPSDKKTKRMNKVYKFRNKWEDAKEMYEALAKFCNREKSEKTGEEVEKVEARPQDQVSDLMSGTTLVPTEPSVL